MSYSLNFSERQIEYMHYITKGSILSGKEIGFNILGDLRSPIFGDVVKGRESEMWIPIVPTSIGTFHTHPDTRAWISDRDYISTITKRQKVICIGGKRTDRGKRLSTVIYSSEVICYVADTLSEGYREMIKKNEEFTSAFWDLNLYKMVQITKEISRLGRKVFKSYEYGVRIVEEVEYGVGIRYD